MKMNFESKRVGMDVCVCVCVWGGGGGRGGGEPNSSTPSPSESTPEIFLLFQVSYLGLNIFYSISSHKNTIYTQS